MDRCGIPWRSIACLDLENQTVEPLATDGNLPERTILVVDDDPDVREYAVAVLVDRGYRVLSAEDGVDALSVLARERSVDLLFTDVVMPRLNGFELAKRARAAAPFLKVLFTSGYTTDLSAADRLLKKPYLPHQLCGEVASMLPAVR
jgi:CheY-like chemotaxis protein